MLDHFSVSPRASPIDHFGLEQADDRFGHRVVMGIFRAADRGLGANVS